MKNDFVESYMRLWDKMTVEEKQQFLTYLQSQGVVITLTEIRFKGGA